MAPAQCALACLIGADGAVHCNAHSGAGSSPAAPSTVPAVTAPFSVCLQWLLNEPLAEAFRRLLDLQLQRGVALVDVLQQLHP